MRVTDKPQVTSLWPLIEPLVKERLADAWGDPDASVAVLHAIYADELACFVVTESVTGQDGTKAVVLATIEDDKTTGRRYLMIRYVFDLGEVDEALAEDAAKALHREAATRSCSGVLMLGECNWLYSALGLRLGCCSFGPVRHEVEGEGE